MHGERAVTFSRFELIIVPILFKKVPRYRRSWEYGVMPVFRLPKERLFLVRQLGPMTISLIEVLLKFNSVKVICKLFCCYLSLLTIH